MRKLFTILVVAAAAFAGWLAWAVYTPVTPAGQKFVLLHPGFTTRKIASELKAVGVIRNERAFLIWHYLDRRHSLKAGEYLFEKTASLKDIHSRLVHGDIFVHTVVIPEGYTMFDIAAAIEQAVRANAGLVADAMMAASTTEGGSAEDSE